MDLYSLFHHASFIRLYRTAPLRTSVGSCVHHTLPLVMLLCLLVACRPGVESSARPTPEPTLPPLKPVGGIGGRSMPPPAWLIVDGTAYPATYGTFCYSGTCVDMVPPEMMPDVTQANVPPNTDTPLSIRIASHEPSALSATIRPWQDDPAGGGGGQQLSAQGERAGDATMYTLDPLPAGDDQVLIAFTTFAQGGDASYIWRIHSE